MWLFWLIVGLVGGFIIGALVWRNNAKKGAAIVTVLTSPMSTEEKIKAIKDILGIPF